MSAAIPARAATAGRIFVLDTTWPGTMPDHPFGWWSLAPPCVAIIAAIATRQVLPSLLAGVLIGVMVLTAESPPTTPGEALLLPIVAAEEHLWAPLADGDHVRIFPFTLLMGAMVGVIAESGGMQSLVESLTPLARSRAGGQFLTWLLGLIVFFDDYANTLLVGHTMRPLCDRLHISREKLAYIVDSTAAPVAGVAIVSTWVAGEISYIEEGFAALPESAAANGFEVFLRTIPYRFYVLLALMMVPLVGLLGRDAGPMWTAERRAVRGVAESIAATTHDRCFRGHWLMAVLPILAMLTVTLSLLVATGYQDAAHDESRPGLLTALIRGNSYVALLYGALAGLLMVAGIFRIVAALALRFPQWGWVLLNGIVTVMFGLIIYRNFPESALWVLGLFVGVEMLLNGISWVMLSFDVRNMEITTIGDTTIVSGAG